MDASIAPSAPPAPIIVCISSINKSILPESIISDITFLILSSNSPLYFEPAIIPDKSRVTTLLLSRVSGTEPAIIDCAKPSTTAVFPTPGSPIRQGLFFVLLLKTCITLFISCSLPITGSSLPCLASSVKSLEYLSKVAVSDSAPPS